MSGAREVSAGVCVYLCCFTYVCVTSELTRGVDLTAFMPEHISYLLNMPSPDSNGVKLDMPESAIL